MAFDKSALGNRYTCFECEKKFYDLNKDPICPGCGADQRENPNPDAREAFLASLSTRGRKKKTKEKEEVTEDLVAAEDNEGDSDDDTLADGGFGEDEDDDMGLSADDLLSGGEEESEPFAE